MVVQFRQICSGLFWSLCERRDIVKDRSTNLHIAASEYLFKKILFMHIMRCVLFFFLCIL